MDSPEDLCNIEDDGATACTSPTSSGSPGESAYRLFGRQGTIHRFMGGGKGKKKKKKRFLTAFISFSYVKVASFTFGIYDL